MPAFMREKPAPISWLQALVPVGFGWASMSLSIYVMVGLAWLTSQLGISVSDAHPFIKSIVLAFMMAGGPEELTKLAFIILTVLLFRKTIRNVYEYVLIGAAVGIGFTIPEEIGYAQETAAVWIRMLTLLGHMVYGMIMGKYLGIARYNKLNNKPRFLQYVLAILIPIILHTLYDACTSGNLMLLSENSAESDTGITLGLIATAAHFIIQFVILYLAKKDTEKHCEMALLEQSTQKTA